MKNPVKRALPLLAAALLRPALAACGDARKPPEPSAPPTASAAPTPTEKPVETPAPTVQETAEPEEVNYLDISGVDFSSPSISIAYDDFAGMQDLAKRMQNFEIEADTVVEIDGEVGSSMMSHTIVIPNAEGNLRVGTTYEVVGDEDLEFPPDETRIHIVGVVRMNENYFNILVVPAELFTVVEEG